MKKVALVTGGTQGIGAAISRKSSLEEKTVHQAEAAETAVKQTIAHAQALNAIVTKSNEQIIDSVQKRFKEGLDESLNITKKGLGKNRQL